MNGQDKTGEFVSVLSLFFSQVLNSRKLVVNSASATLLHDLSTEAIQCYITLTEHDTFRKMSKQSVTFSHCIYRCMYWNTTQSGVDTGFKAVL